MPRRSSAAEKLPVSLSSSQMRPEVGSIILLIIRSDVVLPHPEGPTKTVIWPVGATTSSSSTATVPSGYFFETASNRITWLLPPSGRDSRAAPQSCAHRLRRTELLRDEPSLAAHDLPEGAQRVVVDPVRRPDKAHSTGDATGAPDRGGNGGHVRLDRRAQRDTALGGHPPAQRAADRGSVQPHSASDPTRVPHR